VLRVGFAGCGIKIPLREREFAFMTRGVRDSFKIDGGVRIEKRKIRRCGRYPETKLQYLVILCVVCLSCSWVEIL